LFLKKVIEAAKIPKPVALTLVINWLVKPFAMFIFYLVVHERHFRRLPRPHSSRKLYRGNDPFRGAAPCTAMELVWSYPSKGNVGHTLVMMAINSLTILFLYASHESQCEGHIKMQKIFLQHHSKWKESIKDYNTYSFIGAEHENRTYLRYSCKLRK